MGDAEIGARRELFLVMGLIRGARLLGSCNIRRLRVNYGAWAAVSRVASVTLIIRVAVL